MKRQGLFWRGLLAAWLLMLLAASAAAQPEADAGVRYRVERYRVANYPVALAFAPDGRLFYTEKTTGSVRLVAADGTPQLQPVITLPTDSLVERGLLGIALDPDYAGNGHIWVVHTRPGTARDYPANQVVRFTERDGQGSDPQVMLSVPITNGELKHNGGNLHFDAEGRLYVSFGDYGDAALAQNLDAMPGKIHRFQVTEAGLEPAPDNPFPGSSVYAYGLRNTFDFTFDPTTGNLFGAENGFKCDDEINLILPGGNYGWGPDYGEQCFGYAPVAVPNYQPPLLSISPTVGMVGIMIYDGGAFPAWSGDLFWCEWNSGALRRAVLDASRTQITAVYSVDLQGQFCRIDVTTGPDGLIYFADPSGIYRIIPAA